MFKKLGLIICLFAINLAFSAPKIVYRIDSDSPDVIFKTGFKAWGDNDDVLHHVSGKSTGAGKTDSAFIATTSSQKAAEEILKTLSRNDPNNTYYVYVIHTDDRFYNLNNSLRHVFEGNCNCNDTIVTAARNLYRTYQSQEEWIAKAKIDASNIQEVRAYRWDSYSNDVRFLYDLNNDKYITPNSSANTVPYYFTPHPIGTYYYVKERDGCSAISDAFCPDDPSLMKSSTKFCGGLPILSSPYNKPVTSCQSFVNIQPAINLLFSHSSKPSPTTNPQYPWSTDTICVVAGFGVYDHVDCTSTNGVVNFSGNMGGLGGVGTYDGTMHFSNRYSSFTGKSCSITMDQELLHMHISIDCGSNYTASLSVWGIGAAGVMHGTGSFK